MKALMSSWPRRGSWSEYFSSMSGAAMASTTARLQVSPQNSVNQRPTTALLSSCLLMRVCPVGGGKGGSGTRPITVDDATSAPAYAHLGSCRQIEMKTHTLRGCVLFFYAYKPAQKPKRGLRHGELG